LLAISLYIPIYNYLTFNQGEDISAKIMSKEVGHRKGRFRNAEEITKRPDFAVLKEVRRHGPLAKGSPLSLTDGDDKI
jgi:hypothetical protein